MMFLNGLFADIEDVGLASGFEVVAAGAAGDFGCGFRPAGELRCKLLPWSLPFGPAFRCPNSLPANWSFACPKDKFVRNKLGRAKRTRRVRTKDGANQRNQRKGHPNDTLNPALLALSRGRPKGLPVPRSPRAPLRAVPPQDYDARACHTGPITEIVGRDKAKPFPAGCPGEHL